MARGTPTPIPTPIGTLLLTLPSSLVAAVPLDGELDGADEVLVADAVGDCEIGLPEASAVEVGSAFPAIFIRPPGGQSKVLLPHASVVLVFDSHHAEPCRLLWVHMYILAQVPADSERMLVDNRQHIAETPSYRSDRLGDIFDRRMNDLYTRRGTLDLKARPSKVHSRDRLLHSHSIGLPLHNSYRKVNIEGARYWYLERSTSYSLLPLVPKR